MQPRFVITANHTGAGKTLVSAILAIGLKAHYWKPIQAGTGEETDTAFVRRVSGESVITHPEAYQLSQPRSPHAAAAHDRVAIEPERLTPPPAEAPLIIEGAGGLLVPLSKDFLFADLLAQWQLPVVLVMHTYLGSINHTLLTTEALDRRGIPVAGMVVNEGGYPESAEFVLNRTGYRLLGYVPTLAQINSSALGQVWQSHFIDKWQTPSL